MRVLEALELFLIQMQADGRSAHTIGQYRRHVRLFAAWAKNPRLEEIDHHDVAVFMVSDAARKRPDGTEKKATSVNALRTSVRCFFTYLHQAGMLGHNPGRLVRRARCGAPPPRSLSEEEQARLLKTLGRTSDRDRTLFGLMLRTGIRLGSALALDVEDVDLERGELRLRRAKGGREQVVYVPNGMCDELQAWIGERTAGPLFPGRQGEAITTRHAARRFRAVLKEGGIRRVRGTHCLRHSFATAIYRKTGDLLLTQQALNHRSVASTVVYARADRQRLREALSA